MAVGGVGMCVCVLDGSGYVCGYVCVFWVGLRIVGMCGGCVFEWV